MKEKFEFTYNAVKDAINNLNSKKIGHEQAKAIASLAKQMNNTTSLQIDTAKFLANNDKAKATLIQTGLVNES